MVTRDRSASDASYGYTIKDVWVKRNRDIFFGSCFNPLATKLTGFSVFTLTTTIVSFLTWCAMQSTYLFPLSATTLFLLLPNWKVLNANACILILRKNPEHYTILGTIPQASVTFADKIYGLETMQALQFLNGILKFLYVGSKTGISIKEKEKRLPEEP